MDPVRNLDDQIAKLQKEKARLAAEAAAQAALPSATDEQWASWQGAVVARAAGRTLFASGAVLHGDRRVESFEQRGLTLAQRLQDLRQLAVEQLQRSEGHFHQLKAAVAGDGSPHVIAARGGFMWTSEIASLYGPAPLEKRDRLGRPSAAAALLQIKQHVVRQRAELAGVDRAIADLPEARQRRESEERLAREREFVASVDREEMSVTI